MSSACHSLKRPCQNNEKVGHLACYHRLLDTNPTRYSIQAIIENQGYTIIRVVVDTPLDTPDTCSSTFNNNDVVVVDTPLDTPDTTLRLVLVVFLILLYNGGGVQTPLLLSITQRIINGG